MENYQKLEELVKEARITGDKLYNKNIMSAAPDTRKTLMEISKLVSIMRKDALDTQKKLKEESSAKRNQSNKNTKDTKDTKDTKTKVQPKIQTKKQDKKEKQEESDEEQDELSNESSSLSDLSDDDDEVEEVKVEKGKNNKNQIIKKEVQVKQEVKKAAPPAQNGKKAPVTATKNK